MKQATMLDVDRKKQADPVGELPIVDAYMRWMLNGVEEVFGRQALAELLTESQLQHLVGHYPEESLQLSQSLVLQDYANLSTAIVNRYGLAGKEDVTRVGRISAQPALKNQGKLMNFAARKAIRLLPMSSQIKTVLASIKSDVEKVYETGGYSAGLKLEDRDSKWAYIDEGCACCAGMTANHPICWLWSGTLEESLNWLTGKEFKVEQVSCRAMDHAACVWEVDKRPS
jgi:predicted hydrocarbon binding protein